jgi:hypothetical protein
VAAIVGKPAAVVVKITAGRRLTPLTDAQAHALATKLDELRRLRGPVDDELEGIARGMGREAGRLGARARTCALTGCDRVFVAAIDSQRCCTMRHAARWVHEQGAPES